MTNVFVFSVLLSLFTQVLGFVREIIVANYYGASAVTDAYIISLVSPTIIIGFISSGLASVYIPKYVNIEYLRSKKSANKYTLNLLFSSFIISIFFVLILSINIDAVINIFASGFNGKSYALSYDFLRITIFSIPFILINVIFVGYLQSNDGFVFASFVAIPGNIVSIIFVILSLNGNQILLPLGYLFSVILQFILYSYKSYFYSLYSNFRVSSFDVDVISSFKLALPVVLGVSLNQINYIIDRTMASTTGEGGVSIINYASRINSIIEVVLITTLVAVFYPGLSRLVKESKRKYSDLFFELLFIMFTVTIPATVVFNFYSNDIIGLLFGRGAFLADDIIVTSKILALYSLTIPLIGLRLILNKSYYSFGITKTPTCISSFGVIVNIILNFYLVDKFGLSGLAYATIISMALSLSLLLLFFLKSNLVYFEIKKILIIFLVPFFNSLLSMTIVFVLNNLFFVHVFFVYKILLFIILYAVLSYLFVFIYFKFDSRGTENMIMLNRIIG